MGSAPSLAAKGSQFVIQGANSLARNVHARTRQPAPAGPSQSIEPAGRRASRTANPSGGGGQKQDLGTVWHCLLPVSTPSKQPLPRAFFFSGDPVSHVSQGPGTGITAPPHPPRQAVLGTGDSPAECPSPPLLPVSALLGAVVFSLGPWKSLPQRWQRPNLQPSVSSAHPAHGQPEALPANVSARLGSWGRGRYPSVHAPGFALPG